MIKEKNWLKTYFYMPFDFFKIYFILFTVYFYLSLG